MIGVPARNYLQRELDDLIQTDGATWQFIQQGSLDGVWYWDLENPENEWMSPEFWRTLGVNPAEKTHNPAEWQDIIFQEDLPLALENFEAHCADPTHPYDQVVRYRHSNGSTVWIRCRGMAIRDSAGKPIRMLGAHTDITAVKRSEEDARAGWRAAEAANAELRSFAYSISHDMKAPTNTLRMLIDEIGNSLCRENSETTQDFVEMSRQTVTRMQQLIEYVLDYTRIIGMEPHFEPVSLGLAAQEALENLRADMEERDAQVEVASLPTVKAVGEQMIILIQNLIGNAIKFCPEERKPQISVFVDEDRTGDRLRLRVSDNGVGIPADSQKRIFKLFQRLHGRDEIEGHGLGLSMCQHIALKHRGEIKLSSRPGEGSVFTVELPMDLLV